MTGWHSVNGAGGRRRIWPIWPVPGPAVPRRPVAGVYRHMTCRSPTIPSSRAKGTIVAYIANRPEHQPGGGRVSIATGVYVIWNYGRKVRKYRTAFQPSTNRRKTSDALVPPKPKEFERTVLISRFLAWWGTKSMTVSTAGLSRLIVGGAV